MLNLKLTEKIRDDFEVEIKIQKPGLGWVRKGTYVMTCQHGQNFLVREKKP